MRTDVPVTELAALIDKVRESFRELRRVGDELHADLGVSTAMRAIMEHVRRNGPSTVPDMARAKSVKRQSVQELVDALLAAGLVAVKPNPAHKRSLLVALTRKGEATFDEILLRERDLLGKLAAGRSKRSLDDAARQLSILIDGLKSLGDVTEQGKD